MCFLPERFLMCFLQIWKYADEKPIMHLPCQSVCPFFPLHPSSGFESKMIVSCDLKTLLTTLIVSKCALSVITSTTESILQFSRVRFLRSPSYNLSTISLFIKEIVAFCQKTGNNSKDNFWGPHFAFRWCIPTPGVGRRLFNGMTAPSITLPTRRPISSFVSQLWQSAGRPGSKILSVIFLLHLKNIFNATTSFLATQILN